MSIYGQVISSGEMVNEGNYLFILSISNLIIMFYKKNNTIVPLRPIINGNINVIFYDWNDIVPPCLRSISQNHYNTLLPLHISMEEHDNLMDENN